MNTAPELLKRLYQRQLNMIAIGGVIGAGLFIGSSVVLSTTDPGAFLTYAITVVLIILMMRMLGEMATASPSTDSFADLARRALGGWAGFAVGWLYWYFRVIMVGFEAVSIARDHFSHLPSSTLLCRGEGGGEPVEGDGLAAQRAGAGDDGEHDLQLAQDLVEGHPGAGTFGSVRSRVQNPWAREARVTWRCQPANERPSKWSRPRPVFSSR